MHNDESVDYDTQQVEANRSGHSSIALSLVILKRSDCRYTNKCYSHSGYKKKPLGLPVKFVFVSFHNLQHAADGKHTDDGRFFKFDWMMRAIIDFSDFKSISSRTLTAERTSRGVFFFLMLCVFFLFTSPTISTFYHFISNVKYTPSHCRFTKMPSPFTAIQLKKMLEGRVWSVLTKWALST